MPKTTLKQKTLLVSFSIFLTIASMEIGLRTAGFILLAQQKWHNQLSAHNSESFRILCLGESTTFQGGKNSYPSQLERILNQSSKGVTYEVINEGATGKNMNYFINNLEDWVKQYKPHLVVTMIGINDEAALVTFNNDDDAKQRPFWHSLRTYKLFQWFKLARSEKPKINVRNTGLSTSKEQFSYHFDQYGRQVFEQYKIATEYLTEGEYATAEYALQQILKNLDPKEKDLAMQLTPVVYKELGEIYIKQNRYEDMKRIFQYFFETDALMLHSRHFLEKTCSNTYSAGKIIPLLLEITDKKPNNIFLYDLLSHCYSKTNDMELSQLYFHKSKSLRKSIFSPLTQEKYLKIADILADHEVELLAMQYPLRSIDSLKHMLKPSKHFKSIIFVDNETVFLNALEGNRYDEYFTDRFASDFGHCTTKGYQLLANNLANVILKEF